MQLRSADRFLRVFLPKLLLLQNQSTHIMNTVEQVKTSINGLSVSDQTDVLLHILRLKYRATVQEIRATAATEGDVPPGESLEQLSYDELLERLHLLEGIREGLSDAAHGRRVSHEEVKKRYL